MLVKGSPLDEKHALIALDAPPLETDTQTATELAAQDTQLSTMTVGDDPSETQQLDDYSSEAQSELRKMASNKRQCAKAIVLCVLGVALDLTRVILLFVFHHGMTPFYYGFLQMRLPVIIAITNDFIVFFVCTMLYNLHKGWIQLPDFGFNEWSRFHSLYFATASRLFMWIPLIWGNVGAPIGWLRFVFLLQIVYYLILLVPWWKVTRAYVQGLMYATLTQLAVEPRVIPPLPLQSSTTEMSIVQPMPTNTMKQPQQFQVAIGKDGDLHVSPKPPTRTESPSPPESPNATEKTSLVSSGGAPKQIFSSAVSEYSPLY